MPNMVRCRIAIHLPEHSGDRLGGWDPETDMADRLVRWEIFRDLKSAIAVHEADDSKEFEPFSILRPIPDPEDCYDWCCENWGTKWEMSDGEGWVYHQNTLIIDGDVAWCAPRELIEYLGEELGFDVECQYYSDENETWGDIIWVDDCGASSATAMEPTNLRADDEEDELALELQEWEINNGEDLLTQWNRLTNYSLGLGLDHQGPHYFGDWLDRGYFDNCAEWRVDCLMEAYTSWKEEFGKEITPEMQNAKHEVLDQLEDLLESKQINEGQYLKACNELKKSSFTQLEKFKDMFAPDKLKHARHHWDMVRYYGSKAPSRSREPWPEPQLVEIYS